MKLRKNWTLGFLGFLGFLGIPELLTQDWFGAIWLLWFTWFIYFFPERRWFNNNIYKFWKHFLIVYINILEDMLESVDYILIITFFYNPTCKKSADYWCWFIYFFFYLSSAINFFSVLPFFFFIETNLAVIPLV